MQVPQMAAGESLGEYEVGRVAGLLMAGTVFLAAFILAYRAATEQPGARVVAWAVRLNALVVAFWVGVVVFLGVTVGVAEALIPAIAIFVLAIPAALNVRTFRKQSTAR